MDRNRMDNGNDDGVIIPVAATALEFGSDYETFIIRLKEQVQASRVKITLQANTELVCLYWQIGNAILREQEKQGWGAKVVDRISQDLKDAFPEMQGFSPRNLLHMRKFAAI